MEIKFCLRCNRDWCFRKTGRPLRCGKCGSPYWDKPPKILNAVVTGHVGASPEIQGVEAHSLPADPVEASCGYREWSGERGEYVRCGLSEHGPKVKHGNWIGEGA